MSEFLNLLIFPRQRLRRTREEVDKLSDATTRLYDLSLSGIRWAECREGVFARLAGSAAPEMLTRIPSAKLECTALAVYHRPDGGWGCRLCWKGTVEDAFEVEPDGTLTGPATLEQHAARLVRRFPKVERAAILALLSRETPQADGPDLPEALLALLAPWAAELSPTAESSPAGPAADHSAPDANVPDLADTFAAQTPPQREPELDTCLPFLTGIHVLRRGWGFPLSLLYALFPGRRPRPEAVPHEGMTARELTGLLEQFYSRKLDRLELDFSLPGAETYIRRLKKTVRQSFRATLVLLREGKRCMCLFLDGQDSDVYHLIANVHDYCHVESDQLEQTTFHGQTVNKYIVFLQPDPAAIRREVPFLLARLDRRDDALSPATRNGVWSRDGSITNTPADKQRHQELREVWCIDP